MTLSTDAKQLAALQAQCFLELWDEAAFAALLAMPGTFALVDEASQGLLMIRVVADESEVLTIGVVSAARRRGVARKLMENGFLIAAQHGATAMFLEVDCRNFPAIALYKRLGFAEVGRRKAYYRTADGGRSDALVLRVEIPPLRVGICMQLG